MKTVSRKPTYSEIYMYKNLLWLDVGVLIFLPVFNNLFLQLVRLYTDGNIAYGSLGKVLSVIQEGISLISGYMGIAILCICLLYFGKNAKAVIRISFITHAVTFFTVLLTYFLFTATIPFSVIASLLLDMLVGIAVTFLIYQIAYRFAVKNETFMEVEAYTLAGSLKKHPYTKVFALACLCFGGAQLLILIYTMISDFLDPSLGPPMNTADALYWVFQYLTSVIYVFIGFAIAVITGFLSNGLKHSGKRKFSLGDYRPY